MQQGLRIPNPSKKRFGKDLEALRTWDGQKLPVGMKARIVRVHQQLRLVEDQISILATEKREQLKQVDNAKMRQVAQLLRLPGISPVSSWTIVMEFFGWRQFRNRREVTALAGLTPTPYDSGRKLREQGISKAGYRCIRTLAIEIA
jgi:transposase